VAKITQEDLSRIQSLLMSDLDRVWYVSPMISPMLSGDQKQFLAELVKARAELEFDNWEDAAREARRISELGCTGLVNVFSVKRKAILATVFDNGTSSGRAPSKKKGRKK
jgi:hypothetical protein